MFSKFLSSVFLFFFFIFLLMSCAICRSAAAEISANKQESPFALFDQNTEFEKNGESVKEKYHSFTSPSLIFVENVLVVFAQAKNVTVNEERCDIVESYFDLKDSDKLGKAFVQSNNGVWKKKVVFINKKKEFAGVPTAVANGKNTYLFLTNSGGTETNLQWKYGFISGTVETNNEIKWNVPLSDLKDKLKLDIELSNIISVVSGGSGIVVNDTFFVPVMHTKKGSSDHFVSIITNSSKIEDSEWQSVFSKPFEKQNYPSVVEWEGTLIMMTPKKEGLQKIFEFVEKEWKETAGSFPAVWDNTKERTPDKYGGRNGFITAKIGNDKKKEVIFVTQPVKTQGGNNYNLRLWMTNYKRVYDAGAIATGVEQNISSTLLYAEEKLFAAYEKWHNGNATIYAAHLETELKNANKVLEKWTTQDEFLSKSCFYDNLTLTQNDDCTSKIPINGLVGFLSDNYKDNNWSDEYAGVDAIVKEGTNVSKSDKGLRFNGAGASATWPIGETEQNQRYYLANNGFALVATVKIDDDTTGKDNSVLGIGVREGSSDKRNIRLFCSNGKWSVFYRKTPAKVPSIIKTCVKKGIYHVALILDDNKFSVHIGKTVLYQIEDETLKAKQPPSIKYFYFGVHNEGQQKSAGTAESHVTVTNVLLYNRPLPTNEIEKLKEHVKPVKEIKAADQNVDTNTTGNSDQQTPSTLPPNSDKKKEEKNSSPSRTEDGGAGGGVRVFSLLLAVLCVSAPLLHL